ncbi:MAG TPA: ABC transporter ATP-binding protein [Erysipelotrichaceae bacterium]|nr:ABC transporter ATP-binding protein [Erysipelotrichaceae bacterium]
MIKLFTKYLKVYWLTILVVLGLLYYQTTADLKLPELMSNIVNTGITRQGIKDATIDVVRESKLEHLFLFMSEDDKTFITQNYELVLTGNSEYLDDYPILETESVYILNLQDGVSREDIATVLAKPLLITYGIDSGVVDTSKLQVPAGMDIYQFFMMMPAEQRAMVLSSMASNFAEMSDDMIAQSATVAIKNEYELIGIDTSKIQMDYIYNIGLQMILFALMSAVITILVGLLSARMAAGTTRTIRKDVFSKVENFSSVEFDQFSTASLITRTGNDITQLQMLIVMMFRTFFYSPILAYGAVMNVLESNANMTWIIGLALVVIMSMIGTMFVIVMPKFTAIQKMLDKVNLVARESLTGLMVVRAFKTEKHEEERFDNANKDLAKVNLFVSRATSFLMPLMTFVFSGVTLMIVWYGSIQIDIGELQVGDMMAFMQYSMQIIMSFMMITMMFILIPRASVSSNRILEVLEKPLTILDAPHTVDFVKDETGVVEFDNVNFKYPNADDYVLKNISFKANKGQMTAIIGSTGSGKSSLINLIPRFYDVTSGTIKVNGRDVKEVKQIDLRDRIGYIPQKAILFSGTIESNLRYAKENASQAELDKSIEIAQATNIVSEKPGHYQEPISQGGTNVSGGQKQRLSIARALVKNPDIYIYDDSFSALDYKTDAALRAALQKDLSDKTLIVVAQRISTIMNADQIIVLNEGEIVGRGTHDELMDNCEVYREIAFSQLSKEELNHE